MVDWSKLSHAYGPAQDIPAMLDQLERDSTNELWNDLWSRLCHQGTVYSASFAALPRLVEFALGRRTEIRDPALVLAGAIVVGARQPHDAGDVRALYATEISTLLRVANDSLHEPSDPAGYVYMLQTVLALEGVPFWDEWLDGLVHGEYEVECPACEVSLLIAIGEYGFFSSTGDYALAEVERTPLLPADPRCLEGLGKRLHDTASGDGQQETALGLTYLFGQAACTDCGAVFSVVDRVEANWAP